MKMRIILIVVHLIEWCNTLRRQDLRLVAIQHRTDPAHTIAAPCQNENDSGVSSTSAASAAESTGMN